VSAFDTFPLTVGPSFPSMRHDRPSHFGDEELWLAAEADVIRFFIFSPFFRHRTDDDDEKRPLPYNNHTIPYLIGKTSMGVIMNTNLKVPSMNRIWWIEPRHLAIVCTTTDVTIECIVWVW
jgi:hypothetical protein